MDRIDFFRQTVEAVRRREYPFAHSAEEQNFALYLSEKEVRHLASNPESVALLPAGERTFFTVENVDSLDAARSMRERRQNGTADSTVKPLVLNFANPYTPGDGVLNGANVQEEDLCRRSTLYGSLTSMSASGFYSENRTRSGYLFTDAAILSPCVEVFRTSSGSFLDEPFDVAVLTMAAPYAPKLAGVEPTDLFDVFKSRILGMLYIAASNGYEHLVLGTWGCGAFGNDPQLVSCAFFEAFREIRSASREGRSAGPGCSFLL